MTEIVNHRSDSFTLRFLDSGFRRSGGCAAQLRKSYQDFQDYRIDGIFGRNPENLEIQQILILTKFPLRKTQYPTQDFIVVLPGRRRRSAHRVLELGQPVRVARINHRRATVRQTLRSVKYPPAPQLLVLPSISSAVDRRTPRVVGWTGRTRLSRPVCASWPTAPPGLRCGPSARPAGPKWSSYCASIRSPAMPSRSIQARRSSHALRVLVVMLA